MKTPKPIASSLRRKSRVGHRAVGVDEREHRARRERAEDHLEPELLRGGGEADEQDDRAAHADLRRRVLQPQQVGADAHRALRRRARPTSTTRGEPEQRADAARASRPAPPSPVKNSDSRMIAAKSAIEPPAITSWPSVVSISPASLSTGISTPSDVEPSAIATSSGRLAPARPPPSASDTASGDRERQRVAAGGEPQHAAAQLREVDLEPAEEEQEREAERGHHLDRLVDLDPAEHGRADDDAGHDLEHDRRQPQAGGEAEQERRGEGDGDDDEEGVE